MDALFRARSGLGGAFTPPADKSVTHRALMLAAVSSGPCRIDNPLATGDCVSTRRCLQAMGAVFSDRDGGLETHGVGLRGLQEPRQPLDTENSGTTTRLLAGLIAGQRMLAVVKGDDSLSRRPMGRVVEPLRRMGARIEGRDGGRFTPLCFLPGSGDLAPLAWELPVASAQVKAGLMLAALRATGPSTFTGLIGSRDHTERMLRGLGVPLEVRPGSIRVHPASAIPGFEVQVPGDISSAAFFIAAALITGRELTIHGCGINPTRCGFLEVARRMGAVVEAVETRSSLGEPAGDVRIVPGSLRGARVDPAEVPDLIDELPVLAVLGLFAQGVTEVHGAAELKVKESDRLAMTARMASSLGGRVEILEDGFTVEGPQRLTGGVVDPAGDHRIAMAAAVAAAGIPAGARVRGFECAAVSYPDFIRDYAALGGTVE
jgi:3-phosphoshikimate 1-carboxyvinyltransferase